MNVSNNALPYGSGTKLSGIALAALFIFGTIAAVMLVVPQNAYAAVTMDVGSSKIFGSSLVRVLIEDTAKDTAGSTALVHVEAKRGATVLGQKDVTVTAIGTSGQFELYATTANTFNPAAPTTADPVVVRINTAPTPAGNDDSIDLNGAAGADSAAELRDGDSITFTYGGITKSVAFQSSVATVTADRASAGETNLITLSVNDQDANVDPTKIDTFTVSASVIQAQIGGVNKAIYNAAPVFTETGQNTGMFKHSFRVSGVIGDTTTTRTVVDISTNPLPQSVSLRFTDHEVYVPTPTGAVAPFILADPTANTPSSSVTMENMDGIIVTPSPISFANGVSFSVNDNDQNIDTEATDSFATAVTVTLENGFGGDSSVAYTVAGARVTTTGAEGAGSVSMVQTVTFSSDPGTIVNADIVLGTPTAGVGVTAGTATAAVSPGPGATRTVTITQPFTTTGAVTNISVGNRTVTFGGIDNAVTFVSAVSASAPTVSGGAGTVAGAGNTQIVTATDTFLGRVVTVPMSETALNSNTFVPDLSDDRVTIEVGAATQSNSIALSASDVGNNPDITITYNDPRKDPTGAGSFNVIRTLQHAGGSISAPSAVDITQNFAVTITDSDLNRNVNVADSYIVTFTTTTATVGFGNGAAELKITKDNSPITMAPAGTTLTLALIETGTNTGVFRASSVNMQTIASGGTFEDGDQIKITYTDLMESPTSDSDALINIARPSEEISIDRTTLPFPQGGTVKFVLTVVDPNANTNSASTDTIAAGLLSISVENKAGQIQGGAGNPPTGNTIVSFGASPISLTETGISTGVFTKTISMTQGGGYGLSAADGAKVKFTYAGNTASATLKVFDLSINTSTTNVKNGDTLVVTLSDADRNFDATSIDQVTFTIRGVDDDIGTGPTTVTADETGVNTGVFSKSLVVGTDFKITETTPSLKSATQIEIKAVDVVASTLEANVDRERTISIVTGTGRLTISPTDPGPGTKVTVQILDIDLNASPTGTETLAAGLNILKATSDRIGTSSSLGAKETGANTGVFEHEITFKPLPVTQPPTTPTITSTGTDSSEILVLPGDVVSVRYTDETDAGGNKVTVSATFKIVSVDPTMKSNKTAVAVGGSFDLEVNDVDANTDPDVLDTITLKVTSNSDAVGFSTTAIETASNTGVFRATIQTTDSVEAGAVTVGLGDTVSVEYEDKYPADYADRVETVLNPAKDFTFKMSVGIGAGDVGSTSPSVPTLATVDGAAVTSVRTGQQVVLTSNIKNNEPGPRSYVAIVEVRDDDGITTFLQWQIGTLAGNGQQGVGISWLPDQRGTYELRVFVVSSLNNPIVLSEVIRTSVTVN